MNSHFEGLAFIRKPYMDKKILSEVKSSQGDENLNLKIVE